MKIRFTTILSIVCCLLLCAAALCVGAYRGWSQEREAALSALTSEGGMREQLEHRAMDAANLAVVAARHLPADDADLNSLRKASVTLLSGTEDGRLIMQADEVITGVALRFSEELAALPSVQSSSRDKTYVAMLTSKLGKKSGLTNSYALLVKDYNQRLETSLSGRIAMLLGIAPLPLDTLE